MAKLFFRYGAMGSSKTANALMVQYNYYEKGQRTVFFKPSIDNRDGANIVKSRIGLQTEAVIVEPSHNIFNVMIDLMSEDEIDCVIIDESQFLSPQHIDQLADLVDQYNIPVICYGLRCDFQGNLFEGSRRLMEMADAIEEIKTVCWCGAKAIMNARVSDGRVVREGEQVQIGGNESYISLCRRHWKSGEVGAVTLASGENVTVGV